MEKSKLAFQIITQTGSFGNITQPTVHPCGTENGVSQHIYDNVNIIEILNSGVDDFGGYLNFSYQDADGNFSTGYKHAYYDIPPSTGDTSN